MPSASDQSSATADQSKSATSSQNGEQLPQTASPLPLMGLMGMGSLLTGLFIRRKK